MIYEGFEIRSPEIVISILPVSTSHLKRVFDQVFFFYISWIAKNKKRDTPIGKQSVTASIRVRNIFQGQLKTIKGFSKNLP